MSTDLETVEKKILGEIYASPLLPEVLHHLCDVVGPRFAGSKEEKEAAGYLAGQLETMGLANVRQEPFPVTTWERGGPASVGIESPVRSAFPATALPFSPDTGPGGLSAPLLALPDGTPEEFEAAGDRVKGRIVLTREGVPPDYPRTVHRAEKYGRAVEAGAAGFLFAHPDPGGLDPTGCARFGREAEIPAAGLSFENGKRLERLDARGEVRLALVTRGAVRPARSQNVIGEIPGSGDGQEWIAVGGHLDTHDICPGARDNTSGVCVVLEAARALLASGFRPAHTIRFLAFGAEEIGLAGSSAYVERLGGEVGNIRLMINVDSPPQRSPLGYVFQRGAEAASWFEPLARAWRREVPILSGLHPHSDHFPFFRAGAPVANFAAPGSGYKGGRGFGHTVADTPDKVDVAALRSATDLLARTLVRLASPGGLRLSTRAPADAQAILETAGLSASMRYEGC